MRPLSVIILAYFLRKFGNRNGINWEIFVKHNQFVIVPDKYVKLECEQPHNHIHSYNLSASPGKWKTEFLNISFATLSKSCLISARASCAVNVSAHYHLRFVKIYNKW